jgi:L,D-peptidoglycan transpeptidase YkuD (ErfK/YbiS/YcfS/YnhG family)
MKITEKMGWSDDPEDEDKYNRLVELPYLHSHEKLWRNDDLYNIIVELGYNDKPPIRGRGSAIFMHLMAKDGSSTDGCISLRKNDLLQLISMIEINEALEIKA